jgi:hypothetical protein
MRFSIVFDDNGTVLAAFAGGKEARKPKPGSGVSKDYFDISDECLMPNLPKVERLLIDIDPSKLEADARRKGGR